MQLKHGIDAMSTRVAEARDSKRALLGK